jgi:PHD/YefM family antitoxin component YafN of YafNO toxin-antitoxin module
MSPDDLEKCMPAKLKADEDIARVCNELVVDGHENECTVEAFSMLGDILARIVRVEAIVRAHVVPAQAPRSTGGAGTLEIQMTEFRERMAAVLDDVLDGKTYVLESHGAPKAVLTRHGRVAGSSAITISRSELKGKTAHYIDQASEGHLLLVQHEGSGDDGVLVAPPDAALVQRHETERLDKQRALKRRQASERRARERGERARPRSASQSADENGSSSGRHFSVKSPSKRGRGTK